MEDKGLSYQFDEVWVNPRALKVYKSGAAVSLEPKAFEVLLFLLNNRGRLVEKSEILDAVWKETFVTPNALTRVIAQLRKSLGDDAREAKYIETVPTRGYRFIPEVVCVAETNGKESLMDKRIFPATELDERSESAAAIAETGTISAGMPEIGTKEFKLPLSAKIILSISLAVLSLILTVAALYFYRRPSQPETVSVLKTVQITTSIGLDNFPAVSPDGSSMAYCSDKSGGFDIYVKQLGPGSREAQITSDGENFQPAWSPDGKQIAFHSRRRGGIWVTPAFGGMARQISNFGSRPAWSPDGSSIAFHSGSLNDISQKSYPSVSPSTIWIVSTEGGEPKRVTLPENPPGGHGFPSWSPNGKRLVFATFGPASEICSISINGGEAKRLVSAPKDRKGTYYDPIYSPDGKSIYYSAVAANFRLWKLNVSPETDDPIGSPIEVVNTGTVLLRNLSMAKDGKRLFYAALSMSNNLWQLNIKSGEAQGDPTPLTNDTNFRKTRHIFSPDGKKIAFNVWRAGADGEIWVMDADGENPKPLTADPAGLLGWLPTGHQIAYVSVLPKGPALQAADLITGKSGIISEFRPEFLRGCLSPDGKEIVYHKRTNRVINIWKAPIEGGSETQLTFDDEMMGFPIWSPDGKYISFEVKRGDSTYVAAITKDGGTPAQLTFEQGESWPGSWSRDGDKIVFAGLRNGIWNIYTVSIKDKMQQRLTDYRKPNAYVRYPVLSPLGDKIVYEYAETTGNIWMMEFK